jgi:glycosyltransferase involved in cell wall biosynthesis
MDISVILPVYNERENLCALIDEIAAALRPLEVEYEIIAVNDGSTDGSEALLRQLAGQRDDVKLISFRRNCGQSAAFDAGFVHACGDVVVTMDADGQNDPADIPRMIQYLHQQNLDFVAGERADRQDTLLARKLPSRVANWIIRRVTGTKVRDLGCSLKVYRGEIARELRLYGEMHRFIGVLVEGLGARTGQIAVNHRPRRAGCSKYGIGRAYKVLLDLMTVWFMRGYQTKPLYVFGSIGLLLMAGAIGLSVFVLWEKIARGVWVHRNPLFLLSMAMSVVAVQFFGMGLIAEIMVRTYFESRQKPSYLIAERVGFDKPQQQSRASAAPPAPTRPLVSVTVTDPTTPAGLPL